MKISNSVLVFMIMLSSAAFATNDDEDISNADCEINFNPRTTSVNGTDTSDWITMINLNASPGGDNGTPEGLDCSMQITATSDAEAGDYAFVYNDFGNDNHTTQKSMADYKFGLDLTDLFESFENGDYAVVFHVRSNNGYDQRLLNMTVEKTLSYSTWGSDGSGWRLKLIWFQPYMSEGVAKVNKATEYIDLGTEERVVPIRYAWGQNGSFVEVDSQPYNNPLTLDPQVFYPTFSRLGYINSVPRLKTGDTMLLTSLFSYSGTN